ncbi:MAG: hypothetical protein PUC01_08835 [Spirochaetales bacterium]|nr:hypothetical protein [Spirochaetales bacterium]
MKKTTFLLVLMLIALIFISCNSSTPTKEDSNSSSNGSTLTIKERNATDDDYTLFITLLNVIEWDLDDRESENIPPTVIKSGDKKKSTFTFNSCDFNSYKIDGSPLSVKLNGSAKKRTEIVPGGEEEKIEYYTYSFTKGSSINSTEFTATLGFSINPEDEINFTTAIINGSKVKGLSELVNSKITRDATAEDKELAKKIVSVLSYLVTLEDNEINDLEHTGNLTKTTQVGNPSKTLYVFDNWGYNCLGSDYLLNGEVKVEKIGGLYIYDCNFLNNGTTIGGKNHSIKAYFRQTSNNDILRFIITNPFIDCINVTDFEVEVPKPNEN